MLCCGYVELRAVVTQVTKRWSVYKEDAKVYEVVKVASSTGKKRKGVLFARAKKEEGEARILVVGKYRLWVFTRATKKKVTELAEFHIFGMKSLRYEERTHRLTIALKTPLEKPTPLDFYCRPESQLFKGIVESYRAMTVGFPDDFIHISVVGGALPERAEPSGSAYDHFVANYVGQCSYLKMPVCDEILAYVEQQLATHRDVLDLTCVPAIRSAAAEESGKAAAPSVAFAAALGALSYDTHFRSVVLSRSQHAPTLRAVGRLLARNTHLTKLVATRVAGGDAELSDVFSGLASCARSNVQVLDLSGNAFGPKSAGLLADWLGRTQRAVRVLVLRDCGLHARLLQALFQALAGNPAASLCIEHLDLTGNRLEQAGSQALDQWFCVLKVYARLKRLLLRNAALVVGALDSLRTLTEVEELDIAQNRVDAAGVGALCKFVSVAPALNRLALDGCALTGDAFKALADAVRCNPKKIVLDLSLTENPELVRCLGRDVADLSGRLAALNVSGYRLREAQLVELLTALTEVSGLRRLGLRACSDGKLRTPGAVAKALAALLACGTLEALDIADGVGPAVVAALLDTVAPERCPLVKLDVTGNSLGDAGAARMARWLAHNTTLKELAMDNNHVRTNGLLALASAFAQNTALCELAIDGDAHREYALYMGSSGSGGSGSNSAAAAAAAADHAHERQRLLATLRRISLSLHARNAAAYEFWTPCSDSTVAALPAPTTDATLPETPHIFAAQRTSTDSARDAQLLAAVANAPVGSSPDALAPVTSPRMRSERDLAETEKKLRASHKPIIASRVRNGASTPSTVASLCRSGGAATIGAGSSNGSTGGGTKEPPKLDMPPVLGLPPGMTRSGTARTGGGSPGSPTATPQATTPTSMRKTAITARRAVTARRTGPKPATLQRSVQDAAHIMPFVPTDYQSPHQEHKQVAQQPQQTQQTQPQQQTQAKTSALAQAAAAKRVQPQPQPVREDDEYDDGQDDEEEEDEEEEEEEEKPQLPPRHSPSKSSSGAKKLPEQPQRAAAAAPKTEPRKLPAIPSARALPATPKQPKVEVQEEEEEEEQASTSAAAAAAAAAAGGEDGSKKKKHKHHKKDKDREKDKDKKSKKHHHKKHKKDKEEGSAEAEASEAADGDEDDQ